jgi:hypothetical protein
MSEEVPTTDRGWITELIGEALSAQKSSESPSASDLLPNYVDRLCSSIQANLAVFFADPRVYGLLQLERPISPRIQRRNTPALDATFGFPHRVGGDFRCHMFFSGVGKKPFAQAELTFGQGKVWSLTVDLLVVDGVLIGVRKTIKAGMPIFDTSDTASTIEVAHLTVDDVARMICAAFMLALLWSGRD